MNGQDALDLVPGRESHEALIRSVDASARRQTQMRGMKFGCLVAAGIVAKREVDREEGIDPGFPCGFGERDALV